YLDDGNLNWENSTWINPMSHLEGKYQSNASALISNLTIGFKVIDGLEIKSNFGYTENHLQEIRTSPSTAFDPIYGNGPEYSSAIHNHGKRISWIMEPQLNFNHEFRKFKLGLLTGFTFQRQKSERLSQIARGFTSNKLIENLTAASRFYPLADYTNKYRYQAVYGRLKLGFNQRYFLNITGRRDGSSRFGPNRRFGNFAAIGSSWIFSKEKIIQKIVP